MATNAKLPDESEALVQKAICAYLAHKQMCFSVTTREKVGGRGFRTRISMKGYPDISMVIKGRAVFLEVKAEKGKLSPDQVDCHRTLRQHGALVFVVRSVDETIRCLAGM